MQSQTQESQSSLVEDILGALLVTLLFVALAEARSVYPAWTHFLVAEGSNDALGAEYDSIARAMRAGRGFSDPFEVESGPTAWMTPVLPSLLASLYWFFDDDRGKVVNAVLFLQGFANWLSAFMAIRVARQRSSLVAGYVAVVAMFIIHFFWLFQRTHDMWLLLLVYNYIWFGTVKKWAIPNSFPLAIAWGASGGVIALCSPVAGFTWAVATLVSNIRNLKNRKKLSIFLLATVTSMLTVSPWAVRNWIVLHKLIPVKSNFAYELWQAQCIDDDGVLDLSTFKNHPWPTDGTERKRYLAEGEIEFIGNRLPLFRAAVCESPSDFVWRVKNRFLAACIYYEPTFPSHRKIWITPLQRCIFLLPAIGLSILTLIRIRSGQSDREEDTAAMVYICGILVYVLFSFYQRYSAPLAGMQMLLIVYGCHRLQTAFSGSRRLK